MWTVCTSGAVGKAAASAGHDCRGTYHCRVGSAHGPLVPWAHDGARVLLGERERVSGLAHCPEDRTGTLVDGVHKRCGRQGRRECGIRLPTDLPLLWGPPTALLCPRLTVVLECNWASASE